jgi:RNA polymerase sigma-70 factor (ECF subfamily)
MSHFERLRVFPTTVEDLRDLVVRAQGGDVDAFGPIIQATQVMVYAAALGVVRDRTTAEDAAQEAYLRAFRRLRDLDEPAAFTSWLRRIVITVALNVRRRQRHTLLRLDDIPDVPILDETETRWSESQRQRLARALLTLTSDERRLCDRRYHGGWTTARLARDAGVDEATMRKRLQRIRGKLRKEIEVSEQRRIRPEDIRPDFPDRVVELLTRPRLTDVPENPVGKVLELLRTAYSDYAEATLPEIVDFTEARKTIGDDALYIDPIELHRIDEHHILRYDLTLPLLLTLRYEGRPLRVWAAGKAYRLCQIDATHLDAFHQAEALWLDERSKLDGWRMTGQVLRSVDVLFPGRSLKIVPTEYPMCSQAWELEIEEDGHWFEVLAWGVFTDKILRHLGGDPSVHTAVGVGYGLERLAMLRYRIDDIRKIGVAKVA